MWTITWITCIILSLWLLSTNNVGTAERILMISGAPFYSHNIVVQSLCLALSKRGHEIVLLTRYPISDKILKNYTEIYISNLHSMKDEYKEIIQKMSVIEIDKYICRLISSETIKLFNEPKWKKFYKHDSNEKFDAIIMDSTAGPAGHAIAYRFNATLIGMLPMGVHNYHRYIFGSPILSSHLSNWQLNTLVEGNLSIWQRLKNFIDVWDFLYYWINDFVAVEQEIAKKYLGNDIPHVIDIMKNMSLLLVNQNPVLAYARPEQTNVVFFNGFHIQKTPPVLSKDLKQFLDDAAEGFIYMSLGSITTCCCLPKEILKNFVEVFSKLPYKIVWNCECDELPRKLDNAFISKWFPQQGVLAHPNIKLFIYQGGLQSTEEAVHYAVPLLGIPIVHEQEIRIRQLVSLGVAIHLKLNEVTKENLDTAIYQILNDKSYKERMAYISSLSKDQPYDSMENAIWWIEFAMRHKGINHLRFNENGKSWYQYYDMDIIALLAITVFIITCIIIWITFNILSFILNKIIF